MGGEQHPTDDSSHDVVPQHVACLLLVSGHQRAAVPPCAVAPQSDEHQESGDKDREGHEEVLMVVDDVYLPSWPGSLH